MTDTDTEVAAVLAKYLYDSQNGKQITFTALIKSVVKELASFEISSFFIFQSANSIVMVCRRVPLPLSSNRLTTPTK